MVNSSNLSPKILFAVWELAPFIKIGGLGDVARSLPFALSNLGTDIRIVIPYYRSIKFGSLKKTRVGKFHIIYGGQAVEIEIFKTSFVRKDIPVYLLKNKKYFDIPDDETFAVYDLAVTVLAEIGIEDWHPEIIHCNDSHCGLIPGLVVNHKLPVKTLFTIHNLNYQGKTALTLAAKTGLNPAECKAFMWEVKRKQVNFLLEGIVHADAVNTVSPAYAREIFTEEFGGGLDDVIRSRKGEVYGILNGIDYEIRNPEIDKYLDFHYGLKKKILKSDPAMLTPTDGKMLNKAALQRRINFAQNVKIPLVGFVGRFESHQKGIDLIHKMMLRLNLEKYQFVFLGEGNSDWEERFQWFFKFHPKNVFVANIFNESLASQIYAGCDFLLIPSRFEPCGLIQMIAMRYGCLPIAHATGGLKNTITNNKTGFLFSKPTSHALEKTFKRAIANMVTDPENHRKMIENAMQKDFSWRLSAQKYLRLYRNLLSKD